jgi:hypothetical protein
VYAIDKIANDFAGLGVVSHPHQVGFFNECKAVCLTRGRQKL